MELGRGHRASTHPPGTHSQYSPLECERGGTPGVLPLFFPSILGCQVNEFSSEELGQSHETKRFQYFDQFLLGPITS
jgi:hypothetical protein